MKEFVISKDFQLWLAGYWSVISSVYIFAITFGTVPQPNVRFADTIIGFLLGTVIGAIFAFFYGTTVGSAAKNETIKSAVEQLDKQ